MQLTGKREKSRTDQQRKSEKIKKKEKHSKDYKSIVHSNIVLSVDS